MRFVGQTSRLRPSRRVLGVTAGVVAAIVLLGLLAAGLVLPGLVRRAALERLQAQLTAPVRIERVRLNLFTGRARVENVVIGGQDSAQPIILLPALDLGLSYRALLRGAVQVTYLTFHEPRVFIERTGPESVNVTQALRPSERGGEPSPVTIDQIQIAGGTIVFVDRTQDPPFERTFSDLALTTGRLSTLPQLKLTPTSFELHLGIGRGALVVTGAAAPFGQPGGLELVARMERLDPGLLSGYLPLRARIDLRGSQVDGEIRYVLAYEGNRATRNTLTARVETGPIRFLPPDTDEAIVSFAGLAGSDIAMDFLRNRLQLGDLQAREPRVALDRDPAGTFNIGRLIERAGEPAAPPPPATATETRQAAPPADPRPPLTVALGRARLEGGAIEFTDRTLTPPVVTAVRDIGLRLQDLGLGPGAKPGRIEGEARLESGRVAVAGSLDAQTVAGQLDIVARGVPLAPIRRYLDAAFPRATARTGTADARLQLTMARRNEGTLGLDLRGQVDGRGLALALPGTAEPVVQAGRLSLQFDRLALAPTFSADVGRVQLDGAILRVTRDRQGALNLAALWGGPAGAESPGPVQHASPPPARPPVNVRRVEITGSRVFFTDAAVTPAFHADLRDVRVVLRQAPGDPARMPLLVEARLEQSARVELTGWVTPFATPLRLHVEAAVSDYELAALSPYSVRYASHRITRGRATARTAVEYEAGNFTSRNTLTVQRLELGEEVDPELREGLGIPLGLAVSLLEDTQGEIRLELPVSGGADGLHYQLGSVIRTALRNALVKTVAAPFKLFGSLLTVGGKIGRVAIDPVEFRPGSLEPNDEASERLSRVIDFLKDRPRVALQLRGLATANEVEPLKRERLRVRLKEPAGGTADTPLEAAYVEAGGGYTRNPPPRDEMMRFVIERTEITDDDLRELALARARTIQEALVRRGLQPGRLFVVTEALSDLPDEGLGRVEFELLR
jgi:uncharacterized protein involved in outer membrane biogenesis